MSQKSQGGEDVDVSSTEDGDSMCLRNVGIQKLKLSHYTP